MSAAESVEAVRAWVQQRDSLLAALHKVVASGREYGGPDSDKGWTISGKAYLSAEAAIAKAEGYPAESVRVSGLGGFTYDVCRRCRYERAHCRCDVTGPHSGEPHGA